jgi:hypothetical protein
MTVVEKIQAELKVFEEKKKALVEELRKEFPTMFNELFEQSARIDSFTWRQYTPYFNDGDTCEFGVYADDPNINDEDIYDIEWYDWKYKYHLRGDKEYANLLTDNPNIDLVECQLVDDFTKVIEGIPVDFLKDLFGDHCLVTIHRDGSIDVTEYEHD